jgi:hypothetical protein
VVAVLVAAAVLIMPNRSVTDRAASS